MAQGTRNLTLSIHQMMSFFRGLPNTFLSALKSTAGQDWKRQEKGFILTNNGLNVLLRVFAEILKTFHDQKKAYKLSTLRKFIGKEIGSFIVDQSARTL